MSEPIVITEEIHKQLAVDLFNQTWDLIDKDQRTDEECRTLVNSAHASLYHWRRAGTPLQVQRGEWLISRVYTLLGAGEAAKDHAGECLRLTREHGIEGFDLAFAHEAIARAAACNRDELAFQKHFALAEEAGQGISDPEDKEYFFKDLNSGSWFGVR